VNVNHNNNAVLLSDAKFKQNMTKNLLTKIDKIKTTINKFKNYVRSVLPSHERTQALIKSFAPLINSHVDNRLFKAAPNFSQPLLQFVNGVDFPLVYTTLHASTDLIINWIEIWTVWRPQIWRNEVSCFSTQNLHSFTQTFTLVLVLQGNVATQLSYDGKFFILVMSHFFLIPTLKEFKKIDQRLPKLQ